MKPELSPPSLTRKAGSSLRDGLHSLSTLRSLMEASSWTPIHKKSRAYEEEKWARQIKVDVERGQNPDQAYLSRIFAVEIPT